MSKEYGMDPYDDSYDWQQSKDRCADKPNGALVSVDETRADVVPDITKARIIRAALATEYNPGLKGMSFQQKKGLLFTALLCAVRVQPTAKALDEERKFELKKLAVSQESLAEFSENGSNHAKRFLTLDDIPRSRNLVAS